MITVPAAVLPEGFGLPPLPYLAVLVVVLGVAGAAVWAVRPPVTDRTVVALAPWMIAGGALHAIYQLGDAPSSIAPLFGAPAVYATVAAAAGLLWAGATAFDEDAAVGVLGLVGVVVGIVSVGYGVVGAGEPSLWWPTVALAVAAGATVAAWFALESGFEDAAAAGYTGAVVVFGHALDGVSTAIGHDVLGVEERTPLSRLVLAAGDALPLPDAFGAGWLFVAVKVALAAGIVALFGEYVRERPGEARLILAGVAAVGLGPGAHNLVLFAAG